jgi:hypothetical protein
VARHRSVWILTSVLAGQVAAQAPTAAIVDVHVASMTDKPPVGRQTVIVESGRITWIGPAGSARIPAGATRIEGRGGYLLPGFADMHVHLGSERSLLTYLANGITTVRSMSGSERQLDWRRRVERDSLLGPRIVTAGAIVDGDPPSQPWMRVLTDPAQARGEVLAQRAAGFDFIKVYNSVPRAVYDSIVTAAREVGLAVAGHIPFEVGLPGALAAKQRSIEHLRGYVAELVPATAPLQPGPTLRQRSVVWNYVDRARIPEVVAATRAAGVWNCPTLVVTSHNMLPSAEHARLRQRPELRFLGPESFPDRSRISYLRDFADSDYVAAQHGLGPQLELVAALHRAGAGLLVGTDSWLAGFAFQEELELLERAGITRLEVLRLATLAAAEFLGERGEWGEVTVGQRADLQLVGGDPLASLGNLRRRIGVMTRGRWIGQVELERRMTGARGDKMGGG